MYVQIYNYYLLPIPMQINHEIRSITYLLKNKILAELTQTVEKKNRLRIQTPKSNKIFCLALQHYFKAAPLLPMQISRHQH